MTYKVSKKVIEGLYDLKWAIEHYYIGLDVMFDDELDENDMEDLASFLERIYWDLSDPTKEYIEFNIKLEEE